MPNSIVNFIMLTLFTCEAATTWIKSIAIEKVSCLKLSCTGYCVAEECEHSDIQMIERMQLKSA